ncbi:monoheme cytochrome C [Aureisphaera galaxeae]|uniref:monoheme cytochrome C n=1 Tax=Aureisphaera galaxeae TaxID=1538023 RepID=UPI002350F82F|nr:monoheme cytochrome C [Aureisphaera galaxeae]MDC8005829.1 monoheme cytochrome C [Aureisphaera galaxeae]
MDKHEEFKKSVTIIYKGFVVFFAFFGIIICFLIYLVVDPTFSAFKSDETPAYTVAEDLDEDRIENGIHVRTGLVEAEGLMQVVNNCTNCHSALLVTQNRMDSERWAATIDWMQETQNLWDLGKNEEIIINYLVTNYPVQKKGRRQNLETIEWYELEE